MMHTCRRFRQNRKILILILKILILKILILKILILRSEAHVEKAR